MSNTYTSFMNKAGASAASSRGFKNRNIRNAPPTREELAGGIERASILKLNQRILGGKAVVSIGKLVLIPIGPFISNF